MDQEIVISLIAHELDFFSLLRFRQVNRRIRNIINSEDYWRFRARVFGLSEVYSIISGDLSNSNIYVPTAPGLPRSLLSMRYISDEIISSPPMVKYAFSSVISEQKQDISSIIYLSKTDALFRGLEYVIGVPAFLERCVQTNNLDLLKYGMSLCPFTDVINDLISQAVESNREEIASHLCGKVEWWDEYNGRYMPVSMMNGNKVNSLRITYLSKYRKILATDVLDKDKLSSYIYGLTCRKDISYMEEEEFICLLRENSKKVCSNHGRVIAKSLGINGTDSMINFFLKMALDGYRDSLMIDDLIYHASGSDSISRLKIILIRIPKISSQVVIRSKEMYDFLVNRISEGQVIDGILLGGNYDLFHEHLPKLRLTVSIVQKFRRIPPLMISLLIKHLEDINLNPMRYIDKHLRRIDSMTPIEYNLLRSFGMEMVKPWLSLPSADTDVSLFPHYQADLCRVRG